MNLAELTASNEANKRADRINKALVALATRKIDRRGSALIGHIDGWSYATNSFVLVRVRGFMTEIEEGSQLCKENIVDILSPEGIDAGSCLINPRLLKDVLNVFAAVGEDPVMETRDNRLYLHSYRVEAVIMGRIF